MIKIAEKLGLQTVKMGQGDKNRGKTVVCKGEYFSFWSL